MFHLFFFYLELLCFTVLRVEKNKSRRNSVSGPSFAHFIFNAIKLRIKKIHYCYYQTEEQSVISTNGAFFLTMQVRLCGYTSYVDCGHTSQKPILSSAKQIKRKGYRKKALKIDYGKMNLVVLDGTSSASDSTQCRLRTRL